MGAFFLSPPGGIRRFAGKLTISASPVADCFSALSQVDTFSWRGLHGYSQHKLAEAGALCSCFKPLARPTPGAVAHVVPFLIKLRHSKSNGDHAHYAIDCAKFNESHFGLPPSSIHKMTGLGGKMVWAMTYAHRLQSWSKTHIHPSIHPHTVF